MNCLLLYKLVYCLPSVCKYNISYNINQELTSGFAIPNLYYINDRLKHIEDEIMRKLNVGKFHTIYY